MSQPKRKITEPMQSINIMKRQHLWLAIATFGLTLILNSVPAHAQGLRPSRFNLVPASAAIATCLPNAAATVTVFPREDVRGVDTLDLHAEGLRPNTTFAVFLTEVPVPPFGAVQYIGDFTTNAAGRGMSASMPSSMRLSPLTTSPESVRI